MRHKEYRKLHAEWYELASAGVDHRKEIDFLAGIIRSAKGPVLELGSGTGRILVPLLERGFDVAGIDTSPDMTARCLAACRAKGLKAELHGQSMTDFSLPRKFGVILLASGGLGLFAADRDIHDTFGRVMAHLEPGGMFVYEFEPVPGEGLGGKDGIWTGDWLSGTDGSIIVRRKLRKYDATSRIWEQLWVLDKFFDGRLVETEADERTGRYFTVEEAVRFGESAGFTEIRATDWLAEGPPRKDSVVVTVRCRKPKAL